jgi:hypothetical protein
MSFGLKSVRNRRDDALSRISWDRLESMLAEYYRREGYAVEHVGTGGSGRKFDGGIDLKLRKDGEYILVQSKHWNAMQVPHNAVHELLGVMVNEGATGAILVTSGEFTRAAIEAATKQGHVQLVDGDDLRAMLDPLPELAAEPDPDARWRRGAVEASASVEKPSHAKALLDHAAERLIVAAEDRIRGGSRRRVSKAATALGMALLAKLAVAAFALLIFFWGVSKIISTIQQIPVQQQARMQATAEAARARQQAAALPTPAVQPQTAILPTSKTAASNSYGRRDPDPCHELVDWKSGTYIDHCAQNAPPHRPTDAEIRESQRKADEAIKVIEDSTPDM